MLTLRFLLLNPQAGPSKTSSKPSPSPAAAVPKSTGGGSVAGGTVGALDDGELYVAKMIDRSGGWSSYGPVLLVILAVVAVILVGEVTLFRRSRLRMWLLSLRDQMSGRGGGGDEQEIAPLKGSRGAFSKV